MQTAIGRVRVVDWEQWQQIFQDEIWPCLRAHGVSKVKTYQDNNDPRHLSYFFEVYDMLDFLKYIDEPGTWQLFVRYGAYPIEILTEDCQAIAS